MEHVILCHGWDGKTEDGVAGWNTLAPMLASAGYGVTVLSLGPDNVENANLIVAAVNLVPPENLVHIVAHSMGGLSSRHYLKFLGGHERVTRYIALDTPQYGVSWVKSLLYGNVSQLWSGSQFMKNLNAPDPTPGATVYAQLTVDYTQLLPGAYTKALTGVTHLSIVRDPAILALVLRILQGDYSELTAPNG